FFFCFFFSSRRRHTRSKRDWSSDVCSSDLGVEGGEAIPGDRGLERLADHAHSDEGVAEVRRIEERLPPRAGRAFARAGLRGACRSEERRVGKEWRGGGWWWRRKENRWRKGG